MTGPDFAIAHPTDEHLRPVFYGEDDTRRLYFVPPTAVRD